MNKFKFDLSLDEANMVIQGLAKLPYEQSAVVITNMQKQYSEQSSQNEKASDSDEQILTEETK